MIAKPPNFAATCHQPTSGNLMSSDRCRLCRRTACAATPSTRSSPSFFLSSLLPECDRILTNLITNPNLKLTPISSLEVHHHHPLINHVQGLGREAVVPRRCWDSREAARRAEGNEIVGEKRKNVRGGRRRGKGAKEIEVVDGGYGGQQSTIISFIFKQVVIFHLFIRFKIHTPITIFDPLSR